MLTMLLVGLLGTQVATPLQSSGAVNGIVRTAGSRPLEGVRVALRPA
jgi:hypothetical protein